MISGLPVSKLFPLNETKQVSHILIHFCEAVILDIVVLIFILQVLMDFIKAEISSGSEACLTSCDSDHEKISVKEEEESVLTYPVQKAVDEVDDAVSHYIQ
jgi:hypothetical protein